MVTSELRTRTIVGLEIHVQLATRTKMFCGCPVRTDAAPNSCVCPVCLGHPGTLPVINRAAVEFAVRAGMALNCEIARFTKWDRKSYYYPDLPKNYQISQYDLPIAASGWFEINVETSKRRNVKTNAKTPKRQDAKTAEENAETRKRGNAETGGGHGGPPHGDGGLPHLGLAGSPHLGVKRVRIRRAHLEEDAGKNIHDVPGCTLVDLNRTGTPLLEIVTEPDIESAEEAYLFCTELQRLMVHLGVSEGNMQKGHMRFEPNVNLVIESGGREYRTPIAEVKNLNSFRSVRGAVAFEEQRQLDAWLEDHEYVIGRRPNENRGWSDDKGVTEYQRVKEAAHDYRYFPDPDLVPVTFDDAYLAGVRASLCEAPVARARRFVETLGLSAKDAETILDHRATADLFEAAIAAGGPVEVIGKQFVNVWLALANARGARVTDLGVDASSMAELAKITAEGVINKSAVNQIAEALVETPKRQNAKTPKPGEETSKRRNVETSKQEEEEETRKRGNAKTRKRDGETSKRRNVETSKQDSEAGRDARSTDLAPSPRALAESMGLIQVQDTGATEAWVESAFRANEQAVRDARENPKKAAAAAGFLRGQVMKLSGGKADPKIVGKMIEERLKAGGA